MAADYNLPTLQCLSGSAMAPLSRLIRSGLTVAVDAEERRRSMRKSDGLERRRQSDLPITSSSLV